MPRRLFWLGLAVVAGWLLWEWLRRTGRISTGDQPFTPHAPSLPAHSDPPIIRPADPLPTGLRSAPAVSESERQEGLPNAPAPGSDEPDPMATVAPERMDTPAPSEPAANQDDQALEGVVGYCMRCRAKRSIQDAHEHTTETGRRAARGTCPVCGTNMFTFLKEDSDEDDVAKEDQ